MSAHYTLHHLSFLTSDELELPALLFASEQKTQRIVIFLHGNGSSSVFYKPHKLDVFAQRLAQDGWSLLAFNNRGAHYLKKFKRPEHGDEVILGTWLEKIADCQLDINAAIATAQAHGYTEIVLMGESSGANKICVYHEKQPTNPVLGYALVGGGDDTGLWYQMISGRLHEELNRAREMVAQERGEELRTATVQHMQLSYQSFLDTVDPDGDYNVFPFLEASGQATLSTKPLFHAFASLNKPTLLLYGGEDKYCIVPPAEAVKHLIQAHPTPALLSTKVVDGADHGFSGMESEEAESVASWLKKTFI